MHFEGKERDTGQASVMFCSRKYTNKLQKAFLHWKVQVLAEKDMYQTNLLEVDTCDLDRLLDDNTRNNNVWRHLVEYYREIYHVRGQAITSPM